MKETPNASAASPLFFCVLQNRLAGTVSMRKETGWTQRAVISHLDGEGWDRPPAWTTSAVYFSFTPWRNGFAALCLFCHDIKRENLLCICAQEVFRGFLFLFFLLSQSGGGHVSNHKRWYDHAIYVGAQRWPTLGLKSFHITTDDMIISLYFKHFWPFVWQR